MIEEGVLLDFSAQGQPVHFGHHDIADNDVGLILEYLLQSFQSIPAGFDMEIGGKFLAQIFQDFKIVIDDMKCLA